MGVLPGRKKDSQNLLRLSLSGRSSAEHTFQEDPSPGAEGAVAALFSLALLSSGSVLVTLLP